MTRGSMKLTKMWHARERRVQRGAAKMRRKKERLALKAKPR